MNGEERSDEKASPNMTRDVAEQEEEQENRNGVENNVREVMPTSAQVEELTIEHVRKRRERMPVPRVRVRERPHDSFPANAVGYKRVCINVNAIVVVDEVVTERLAKNEPGDPNQEKTGE